MILRSPAGDVVETAELRIGFRRVEIRGVDLLINGRRVYLRGVNRHDFDQVTGRVISVESMRADLVLMKQFGFNAVRTSHYPNDPAFTDLTDELGLYVISEADIESHAFQSTLCDDPRYLSAWVERVARMVQRDKHHPSIIAWSLGNESGYGANHAAAAGWVRRYDPSRPLHYEGAIRWDWTNDQGGSDIVCPMYPEIGAIVDHARSGLQQHPLIMCEFSHAMGNSNGTLAEYWDAIESTPGPAGRVHLGVVGPRPDPDAPRRHDPLGLRRRLRRGTPRRELRHRRDGLAGPHPEAGDVGAQGAGRARPRGRDAGGPGPRRGHDPEPPGLDRSRLAARPVRAGGRRRRRPRGRPGAAGHRPRRATRRSRSRARRRPRPTAARPG